MTPASLTRLLRGMLLVLAVAGAPGIGAELTPQQLVSEGHLQLASSLAPSGDIVPGQKLTLSLTIATDRWFTGGTRIALPEVPGLVILQTEQFATNASERRGEQNWVLQRWTLDVYPQRAGQFTIPPITARVKVNAGDAGDVEGALRSTPLAFAVTLPPALADVARWVAAPAFSVSQRFDRSLENLQVGDAFEREILFEASDVMAMMLPTFDPEEIPGLAAYPAPPVLDNSSNRGQVRASRRQRISYVVQAEGQFRLAGADFFWWDTRQGELRVLSLPATVVAVGPGGQASTPVSGVRQVTWRQALPVAAGVVLLAALLALARRYWPRLPLQRLLGVFAVLRRKVRQLRRPALPERLNPGSSAGE